MVELTFSADGRRDRITTKLKQLNSNKSIIELKNKYNSTATEIITKNNNSNINNSGSTEPKLACCFLDLCTTAGQLQAQTTT